MALVCERYAETVLTNIGVNIIMTLRVYALWRWGTLIAPVGCMALGTYQATVLTLSLHVPCGLALFAAD